MTLSLHRADRTDALADGLAALLATPPADPFESDFVVVPAKGVERWLSQRLSHRLGAGPTGDGVCAAVRFANPHSLIALLSDADGEDPWAPERLVWTVLTAIDAALGQPWAQALTAHLGASVPPRPGDDQRRDRRYAVAQRLARLFAGYAVQRPAILADWADGGTGDGLGGELEADLHWQARLYRDVLARLVAAGAPTPAQRHRAVLDRIAADAGLPLPSRVNLFGHTRLHDAEVAVLAELGRVREVNLWLPHPSPAFWDTLAPIATGPVPRREDATGRLARNPLLGSLGRETRELQRTLAALAPDAVTVAAPVPRPDTLLGRLQRDLVADAAPAGDLVPAPGDDSVQVHACHGTSRQVDVLREVLVGLFQDDPTLEPRDVLIMCPDIEAFAPLFEAGFGLADAGARHPAHGLRVRLADRSGAATNPLLDLAIRLAHLAGGRVRASDLLDLLGTDVVRERFRFSEDELATIGAWVQESGIRWGLAPDLRGPFKLPLAHNTVRLGLDRILVGVAMAEDSRTLGHTLPLDDVGSGSVDLAGRLAEALDRVETTVRALLAAGTVPTFLEAIRAGVRGLADTPDADRWQVARFERDLEDVRAGLGAQGADVSLGDVRRLLDEIARPRPTRANFRTGALTVATMVPMRSVPHRVICLVGLDDGVFPRQQALDGDDALARDPRTGERDVRAEDRQLLLDAILAATDTLVVTYSGFDEFRGDRRPPAVPVGEVLDALARTVVPEALGTGTPDEALRGIAVHTHPLQPFDARNFHDGPGGSFDRAAAAGAAARTRPRLPATTDLLAPLPAPRRGDVALADLQGFLANPARAFLRDRLGVGVSAEFEDVQDAIPIDLDPLTGWAIGDRLIQRAVALPPDRVDLPALAAAERSRGDLPPLALGGRALTQITDRVGALLAVTEGVRALEPDTADVTVDLGGRRRLTGQIPGVRGTDIVRIHYSTLGPKHRLAAWVELVALAAARPEVPWRALTFGRRGNRPPQLSELGPIDGGTAARVLADLVDVRDRGLARPVPAPVKTAAAWAEGVRSGESYRMAANAWDDDRDRGFPGEQSDAWQVRLRGGRVAFAELVDERPDAEGGETWNGQDTRLGQYALRIWAPLLEHERVGPA